MPAVHHRYTTIDGHRLFFRAAGSADAPVLVLLHGFPTSSYMFRQLIPALADRYHVIAPDHLGFGLSDAPDVSEFDYTFDALTALTAGLLRELGVERYAMYVQDYGAPIGWRLALADPAAITAIISQNGNGYDAGFVEGFWTTVWDYQREQTPDTEAGVRTALDVEGINEALDRYPDAQLVWVQDEPENQGAWPFISLELVKYLEGRTVRVVSRPASASPATGSSKVSAAQQTALIETALAL